ncbi:MAG: F0F1 ATP synthase subunit B [Planctomycetes bacterium]|nr:F0F1 ATP synthase subunit B [Planctomycetota bacterium]
MTLSSSLLAAGDFNPLSFDPGAFWLTLLTFGGLLFILTKYAWKPILTGVEARELRIEEAIARAEKDREDASRMLAEYKDRIKNVETEVAALREKGRADAEAMRSTILSKAEADASDRVERALREIELARTQAVEDIRREAVGLGMAVASKVVGRSLEGDDYLRLANDVVEGLKGVGN